MAEPTILIRSYELEEDDKFIDYYMREIPDILSDYTVGMVYEMLGYVLHIYSDRRPSESDLKAIDDLIKGVTPKLNITLSKTLENDQPTVGKQIGITIMRDGIIDNDNKFYVYGNDVLIAEFTFTDESNSHNITITPLTSGKLVLTSTQTVKETTYTSNELVLNVIDMSTASSNDTTSQSFFTKWDERWEAKAVKTTLDEVYTDFKHIFTSQHEYQRIDVQMVVGVEFSAHQTTGNGFFSLAVATDNMMELQPPHVVNFTHGSWVVNFTYIIKTRIGTKYYLMPYWAIGENIDSLQMNHNVNSDGFILRTALF
jgi:uncharacterized protein YktA (UPF0223 family)